jgi:hypothetical protein
MLPSECFTFLVLMNMHSIPGRAMMMEAVSTSETSVNFYQTTRRNIPEDSHLHNRRRKNLKSKINSERKTCKILGSHGGEDFDVGLVGCNAVWTCGLVGRFQHFGETCCLYLQG